MGFNTKKRNEFVNILLIFWFIVNFKIIKWMKN